MSNAKRLVQDALDNVLVTRGFRRRGSLWTRATNDVTQSVELQKSQYGEQFYLNVGLWLNALGTLERVRDTDMHIRLRPDTLFNPIECEEWVRHLDFDQAIGDAERQQVLTSMMESLLIARLDAWQSQSGVQNAFENGDLSHALILGGARAALVRPNT
jgi:hypothetical protein